MAESAEGIVFDVLISSIFILVAIQLLFPLNGILPIDRRVASLFGAVICTGIITMFPTVSSVNVGTLVNFDVLLVLTSIMIINFLLLRQPWLRVAVHWMQAAIRSDVDRGFYIVSAISFISSPLILNDGLCLMLVHPVLDAFVDDNADKKLVEIRKIDAFYYLLAIACSANIGSVMTFSGNPQNLIVAQYLSKFMNCASFFALMLIPALVSWIATIFLLNYFRKQARASVLTVDDAPAINALHAHSTTDVENNTGGTDEALSAPLDPYDPMSFPHIVFSSFVLLIVLEFVGIFPLGGLFSIISVLMLGCTIIANYYFHAFRFLTANVVDEYSPISSVSIGTHGHTHMLRFRGERIPPSVMIRKISCAFEELFHQLDYNLLFIFIGLFVVSGSFIQTGIPKQIWTTFSGQQPFMTFTSVLVLSIYIIVASQLVGNVPVVYMAKEEVESLSEKSQVFGWLILSWVSTVAGNFTLVGSAANIIVVEKAARHKLFPIEIRAIPHFRICGAITLMCIAVGVFVLYVESFLL